MRELGGVLQVVDRTMALFVGLAVGAVVTMSFGGGSGDGTPAVGTAPASAAAPTPSARAAATTQRPPAEAVTPRLVAAARDNRRVEIGVFGDSFGEGIWAGLYNQLRRDPQFEVRQFAERSTGFTRYRSFNILDDVRTKLDRQPVDIAILSFGANDTQGIYYQGHGHAFMTEGWQRIVAERVDAVVGLLRQRGVLVYWVGLPRMRDPHFDTDIQAMNRFYSGRMAALGVPYIDTLPMSVDARGRYMPYLPAAPGQSERRMARANDGIHMTIPGYIHLTEGLTGRLRNLAGRARSQARAEATSSRRQG